jgi:hypothetical protein
LAQFEVETIMWLLLVLSQYTLVDTLTVKFFFYCFQNLFETTGKERIAEKKAISFAFSVQPSNIFDFINEAFVGAIK